MTSLIKKLEKELVKSENFSLKLEAKYYKSKNEKNEFWGDDNIYKELKKSWEVTNVLFVAIEGLKKNN